MSPAPIVVFILVTILFVVFLWRIGQQRKEKNARSWQITLDEQFKRLENMAIDVCTMIGDVEFEQVHEFSPGEYDIWFKIRVRRNNKIERFNLYINIDNLLPLSDNDLDREMTKEVRSKCAAVLSSATNSLRTYTK